jgi:hypothetical protein
MVHVPMRDPDLLKRQPLLLEAGQQPRRFPAGSMTAAFLVSVHQTMVQFCCSGVTGAIMARTGGSCVTGRPRG